MWIVRLALRRPYTVAALCLLILLAGGLSIARMRTDILPAVDIPVVVAMWNFPGLSAADVERRMVLIAERGYSTSVDNVEHIESESISGIGVIKVYLHQGSPTAGAVAQMTGASQTSLRLMPPGTEPPYIITFNASNVPVTQLTITSKSMSAQQIFDYTNNFLRLRIFTVPGLQTPPPYGGSTRQVSVDLDPGKLAAKQLSPQDVVTALLNENVILPAGYARIGQREYDVLINSSPDRAVDFNRVPVKVANGAIVYLGDVAHVYDGYAIPNNSVHVNGDRATYLAILKKSDASTLAVVDAVRNMLPALKAAAPEGMELKLDFDQSVFVRAAISSVLREALISGGLVALMILGFLGSWRSVLIVAASIPLSILVGVLVLFATGNSLNLMTLGGLALAIGMLVDDATVEIENIHRNRQHEPKLAVAILDSAQQVALPALATTATVCIVFFPVVMLTGPARSLFVPLALAVVGSMVASYLLSRTLVPAMSHLLMRSEPVERPEGHGEEEGKPAPAGAQERMAAGGPAQESAPPTPQPPPTGWRAWGGRLNRWRDRIFNRLEERYAGALRVCLAHPIFVLSVLLGLLLSAGFLYPLIGLDFFPSVDTGLMKLHYRAPIGTRIEDAETLVAQVERAIREVIPPDEIETINDNLGIPIFVNLAFVPSDNVGGQDADILISLKPGHHSTAGYEQAIRDKVEPQFPGSGFYFQPADVITQVLDFGVSAPIDVQVQSHDNQEAFALATTLLEKIRRIPGTVDVHIPQVLNHPALQVEVDRDRAAVLGLQEKDVANDLITSLTGSSLSAPNFWVSPDNNVNYNVVVQTPLPRVSNVDDLRNTPITGTAPRPSGGPGTDPNVDAAPYLSSVARLRTLQDPALINHYNVLPVVDVQCATFERDLGAVTADIQAAVKTLKLPKGVTVSIRGESQAMFESFGSLALGLLVAIALVYLLLVILLQSWLDPLIIMVAIPGALVGVAWMLALTGTTVNVESLMGTIMVVGIAVSNSNLVVNFANDVRAQRGLDSIEGAVVAGQTRLRPVLMTAIAMILGMTPMALALGEGGEQNAPLGRAVIGGLVLATFVTLFVVPVVYSRLRRSAPQANALDASFNEEIAGSAFAERA